MTMSKAFTKPNSLAAAASLAVTVAACFVLFVVTDRTVSPSVADVREGDETRRALAVSLGDLSEPTRGGSSSRGRRPVPPAPHTGATLRRDLPDVGSDDRPPGGRTGRARARDRCARGGQRRARSRARAIDHRRPEHVAAAHKAEDRRHPTGTTEAIAAEGVRSSAAPVG